MVTENGSLTPICSLSNRSLSPSLTVRYLVQSSDSAVLPNVEQTRYLQKECTLEVKIDLLFFLYPLLTVLYRVGCDGSPGQGNDCCTSQNQCGEMEGRVSKVVVDHDDLPTH